MNVELDGATIHVNREGNGPPALFNAWITATGCPERPNTGMPRMVRVR